MEPGSHGSFGSTKLSNTASKGDGEETFILAVSVFTWI
jgi:hypothetical protein